MYVCVCLCVCLPVCLSVFLYVSFNVCVCMCVCVATVQICVLFCLTEGTHAPSICLSLTLSAFAVCSFFQNYPRKYVSAGIIACVCMITDCEETNGMVFNFYTFLCPPQSCFMCSVCDPLPQKGP